MPAKPLQWTRKMEKAFRREARKPEPLDGLTVYHRDCFPVTHSDARLARRRARILQTISASLRAR